MMLASIVLPRPTSSARMARPLMWRSTRWATSIWCGSALIAFVSSVISRSKPGTRAIRSASRRSSCQARSVGGAWRRFANASRECSSTDQTSSAGGVGGGRTVGDSGIDTQRMARGPQYTSYQLSVISSLVVVARHEGAALAGEKVEVCAFVRLQHVIEIEAPVPARQRRLGLFPFPAPLRELIVRYEQLQPALCDVELDLVAVLDEREHAAGSGLRRDVQHHRSVGRAAHARV